MSEPRKETGPPVPFDAEVAKLAAEHQLVFTLSQLIEAGLTASGVRKRTTAGRLHRIHHAVYSTVAKDQLPWRSRYMAAVLACGDGAVISVAWCAGISLLSYLWARTLFRRPPQ